MTHVKKDPGEVLQERGYIGGGALTTFWGLKVHSQVLKVHSIGQAHDLVGFGLPNHFQTQRTMMDIN